MSLFLVLDLCNVLQSDYLFSNLNLILFLVQSKVNRFVTCLIVIVENTAIKVTVLFVNMYRSNPDAQLQKVWRFM